MKKLGVVAGMGPFAATYFIKRVLQFTPAEKEWDYFRIFADYNTQIPSRTRAMLYGEASPANEMIRTINELTIAGADVVAVPCNSAHGWYEEVSKEIMTPWLNLIEVTADAVKQRNINKALIVSAYVPATKKMYDKYLNTVYPTDEERKEIYQLIERLKLNESATVIKKEFYNIISHYKDEVDGIVIACTEPSMLFAMDELEWKSFQVVDSTNEYAKKCVEICKGGNNNG